MQQLQQEDIFYENRFLESWALMATQTPPLMATSNSST